MNSKTLILVFSATALLLAIWAELAVGVIEHLR